MSYIEKNRIIYYSACLFVYFGGILLEKVDCVILLNKNEYTNGSGTGWQHIRCLPVDLQWQLYAIYTYACLEIMTSYQNSKSDNRLKNNYAKLYLDLIWNKGALGFLKSI